MVHVLNWCGGRGNFPITPNTQSITRSVVTPELDEDRTIMIEAVLLFIGSRNAEPDISNLYIAKLNIDKLYDDFSLCLHFLHMVFSKRSVIHRWCLIEQ